MSIKAKSVSKVTLENDAMDLALLLYDMYIAKKASDKISNGQNNANDTKDE
ncbi:hypothetical protein D3C73_15720 [compost metagenome]